MKVSEALEVTTRAIKQYTDDAIASIPKTEIDKTLLKENTAADAKTVGEALAGKQPVGDYALTKDVPIVHDWALAKTKPEYTAAEIGAEPSGTANSVVLTHNAATDAHADIREAIAALAPKALWNYDGVALPKFEYEEDKYSHVVLLKNNNGYFAACSEDPWVVKVEAENNVVISGTALCYVLQDGQWVYEGVQQYSMYRNDISWAWSTTEIKGSDNTIYFDAGEQPTQIRTARNIYIIDANDAGNLMDFGHFGVGDVVLVSMSDINLGGT
jgi:hypothetical protein